MSANSITPAVREILPASRLELVVGGAPVYRKADTARLDEFIGPKAVAVPWTNVHYTA